MLENLKKIWSVDWGENTHKNWAEKERSKYQKGNKADYEFFKKRLNWFQGKSVNELLQREEMERIGKNQNGHKLNLKVRGSSIRIFGFLENNHSVFHALLFLVKKTNKVTKTGLKTFEERLKIYEK